MNDPLIYGRTRFHRPARLVLLFSSVLVAALSLPWMTTLGVEHDEALFWPATSELVFGASQQVRPPDGISVLGHPVRFMLSPYIGALNPVLNAGPVALFGPKPITFRCVNLIFLLLLLVSSFALAETAAGTAAAVLTVLFLAVDLELLLQSPTNQGPFLLQMLGSAIAVRCLVRRQDPLRIPSFIPVACGFALALNEKLTYSWVIALVLSGYGWLYWKSASAKIAKLAAPAAVFVLLMSPALIYLTGWFDAVRGFVQSNTAWPADPATIAAKRFESLYTLLGGQWSMQFRLGEPALAVSRFSAMPAILFCGLITGVALRNRFAALCLWVSAGLVLLNVAFPDGGRLHHLILMYPLVQAGAAAGIITGISRLHAIQPRLAAGSVAVLTGLLIATGVSTFRNVSYFNRVVQARGGAGHWSGASLDLANWERKHPDAHIVYAIWGLERAVYAVNRAQHRHTELYFALLPDPWDTGTMSEVQRLLRRRETVWVFSYVEAHYRTIEARIMTVAANLHLNKRVVYEYRAAANPTQVLYRMYSFVPEDPPERSWSQVQVARISDTAIRIDLAPGYERLHLTLDFAKVIAPRSIFVELRDAGDRPIQRHFRPVSHFPIRTRETWEFGDNRYPDSFLVDFPGSGNAVTAVIWVDSAPGAPSVLEVTSAAVSLRSEQR